MKRLALALTSALSVAAAQAAIAPASSGNGELFLNVVDAVARVSYAFDLGVRMDDFFISGQPDGGTQRFWVVDTPVWRTYLGQVSAADLTWSVLAADSVGSTGVGLQRLYTTVKQGDEAKVAGLTNPQLTNGIGGAQGGNFFGTVNSVLLAQNGQSTHSLPDPAVAPTDYDGIHGDSFSRTTDTGFGYYGKTGGLTATLNGNAPFSAVNAVGKSSWFYYLTRSGASSTGKVLVDEFDNGDGANAASGHDGHFGFTLVNDASSPYDGQYLLSYTLDPRVWAYQAVTLAQREFAASIGRTELTGGRWVERLGEATVASATEQGAGWVLRLDGEAPAALRPAVTAVPEPGSAALLLAGGAGLWWRRRRAAVGRCPSTR